MTTSFSYHTNWKISKFHTPIGNLYLLVIVPIAKGGSDSYENLITTSMENNLLKFNFL
ncbi:conserved hypothetical protein [Leptospira interrogans serovar Manilae]|uniref:Uncharacterized protein n=2 Tax=Leptospira interrogans TaxID=173 RepID=A0AAQ1SQ60_LEPIR|nr:hypothetical protein LEP1GSC013_3851 [Leptospira interrogans serovar Valbuzzi str. Duyster]EMM96617.1 hypothetical protein LEP1GSC158_1469 [Leptospira interrogans serovar Zanoni str. LT2156]ENO72883.1 hypothetical protein LEP1GSC012_1540 [Leptospira interrogans serovar Valbuzzi str. Valbuzzi]SOR62979.1 conserved hypothetical protein [Leptospira interrogans serovar Manilae]